MDDKTYLYRMDAPVSEPPRRVVSLVPSVTETLFEIGVGDRVVGITDYCVYPEGKVEALPHVGGTKNPDVAKIIALRPDLVIVNREENRKEDADALQAAGIPVWVTFPRTVREAFNLIWNIMHVFEEPTFSEGIRAAEWMLDWLERMAEAREDKPCKVFAPIWLDPLMTFNADTFAHDMLRVCGGTNVFAERDRLYPLKADLGEGEAYPADDPRTAGRDTRYPRVTLAEVEAAQPDVILLPSEPFPFSVKDLPIFQALNVPAARSGRIILMDGSLLTWHGTRMARAMNTLPGLLCPDEPYDASELE